MHKKPQPVDVLARARVGERWVVRRRLPDGSATDVIGWVEQLKPEGVSLSTSHGDVVLVPPSEIITARQAPAAAGGPDPLRTPAEDLERFALRSWLAWNEPLGKWTLRAGGGFTGRANSCLAVGDPGMPIADAAARIVEFSRAHGIDPWVQVISGSGTEAELRQLGWVDVHLETEVLVCRLATFLGESLPDPGVAITEVLTGRWLDAYRRSCPHDAASEVLKMILAGSPPTAFADLALTETRLIAIGRGHVSGPWLGLCPIWTDPGHRRHGLATKIMIALGHWGARQGARHVYIPVKSTDQETLATCTRLGFRLHHRYRYLAAP